MTTTVPETSTTSTVETTTSKHSTTTEPGATPTPFNGADAGTSATGPAAPRSGSAYLAVVLLFGSAGLVMFAIAPWRRRSSRR